MLDTVQRCCWRSRRRKCVLALLLTISAGLIWRLAPLPLSEFAFKYGGSVLWAAAVYWAIASIRPGWYPGRVALWAVAVAFSVELFKKVYWAPLDRFRETLPGKLLLGRYFGYGAMVAYILAISLVCVGDLFLWRERQRSSPYPL